MAAGELTPTQFTRFLATALEQAAQHSAAGSLHYICMDWRHQYELMTAALGVYAEFKNLCIWVKDNAGMGSLYRSQHELVFVFKNGRTPYRNNVELGRHGRNRSNVWHYPSLNNFGRKGEEGDLAALHPTVKPVALIADAILDCSARGDLVLDPFLGSGSTLLAAERVGRVCRGMELDPLYVDAAIRRWQHLTGDSAVHAVTRTRFDDFTDNQGCHGRGA
jgi:DNA modification methylase